MRDYCDAQAGLWLNSKFWSKFSRKPLSGIEDQIAPPPHFGKLQIWDDQSLLQNTPTPSFWKTSDLWWPKFTPEYPPHFRKLQIWDDQSLLWNTPPFRKTSDLGWPKFTLEYPSPFWKTSDLGWPKFTPEYPRYFRKLQIWDDQSLLWNTPPNWKLSESPSPRVSEYLELLHVETLSNPDNY